MVEHLSTIVENFPGTANQTRCFTHILNLVAKNILRQFDTRKKAGDDDAEDLDDATKALAALELELEDSPAELAEDSGEEGDDMSHDDEDGLGDGRSGMSDDEMAELEENIVPIRLMLTKVSLTVRKLSNTYLTAGTAARTCQCNQELLHDNPPSLACEAWGTRLEGSDDAT